MLPRSETEVLPCTCTFTVHTVYYQWETRWELWRGDHGGALTRGPQGEAPTQWSWGSSSMETTGLWCGDHGGAELWCGDHGGALMWRSWGELWCGDHRGSSEAETTKHILENCWVACGNGHMQQQQLIAAEMRNSEIKQWVKEVLT